MQVEIINGSREESWDKMVAQHPLGFVYQTTAFKRVIAETYPHCRPYYIALVDRDGIVKGGIPLFLVRSWLTGTRLVSLPFIPYSDPLVCSDEELRLLVNAVLELYTEERVSYVEIKARNCTPLLERCTNVRPVFYHRTYWIDLTQGLDSVWSHLHKTAVQQRIRRSEREGIVVRTADSERDVMSFNNMLEDTRRRLGLPPRDPAFFQKIWQYLTPLGMASFLLAEMKGRAIGGAVVFIFRTMLHVGYIASKQEYWPAGVDQALFWKALQVAFENSCSVYDIGKTSPFAQGLVTYKKRWGTHELETPCFYYPSPQGISMYNDERKLSQRIMTEIWRRLPRPLLRMGGRLAYRHLG